MKRLLRHRWARPILLAGVPVLVVVAGLLFWLWGGRYVSTENAYVKADIAQIAAEVAGRVLEVHVQDHAYVKTGDVLFTIDQEPFKVALAKAESGDPFYKAKLATARFYYAKLLPETAGLIRSARAGLAPLMEMEEALF